MRKVAVILIVFAFFGVSNGQKKWGFDTPYGFIPNDNPGCRIEVNLSEPLHDGQIIDLSGESILARIRRGDCGHIAQWRVTEYKPGKYFASMVIPFPDPLILYYLDETPYNFGRLSDELECKTADNEAPPIKFDHEIEVLKTEECVRVLSDTFTTSPTFRGRPTSTVVSHKDLNRREVSEVTRWLVKVYDSEAVATSDFTLMVVEEFAPEHGNARWHENQWPRFYEGDSDVTAEDCPPGDWRDLAGSFGHIPGGGGSLQSRYDAAAGLDYSNTPPWIPGGMQVIPPGGTTAGGKWSGKWIAQGDQTHRVFEASPGRCVAVAKLSIDEEVHSSGSFVGSGASENPNAEAFRRRMTEDDPIYIEYTPMWERSHIWWRAEEELPIPDPRHQGGVRWEKGMPEGHPPNAVPTNKRSIKYRGTDDSGESVIVPSTCGCPGSSD